MYLIEARPIKPGVTGHNGHKPKRSKPNRAQIETATNRNGHKQKRPQTGTATNRNGHRPKAPKAKTATNRSGHTRWYTNILQGTCMTSGLQNMSVNNAWILVVYSGMWKFLPLIQTWEILHNDKDMILWDLKEPSFYVYLSDKITKVWACCVIMNQSDSDNPMPIDAIFSRSFS